MRSSILAGAAMAANEIGMFEVRAERMSLSSARWAWAIYRKGAVTPSRKSMSMFATDAEAIEAGDQVIAEMRRRASHSSFVGPGV